MRKMACIYTQVVFAALWIFLFIDEGVHAKQMKTYAGEPLAFWNPDPQFDFRKRANKVNESIEPIKTNKTNWSFRGKQSESKKLFKDKHRNWLSNEDNAKLYSKQPPFVKEALKSRYNYSAGRVLRMGDRHKVNDDLEAKSTRIIPLSIVNQDEASKKNPDKEQFVITSYTVGDQYKKLLSELTEADVEMDILGRTASYNNILLFKICEKSDKVFRAHDSKYVENDAKDRKIIFIVHALSTMGLNELYALTTENYLKKLLSYYLAHLDKFDIYLMPLANPDGLAGTRQYTFWNKNLSPNSDCPGVDVDRNFDVAWNSTAELSSCSQHYPGVAPFSEPESRAVRDVLHSSSHKIVAYIHVHAGTYDMKTFKGDAVLYPSGFTDRQTDDDKYIDLKGEIDEAIKNANFKVLSVTVDTLYNWYGQVLGTSVDYAATVYGIPYAIEMVMQVYQDTMNLISNQRNNQKVDELEFFALTEIWSRIINVTFNNIHKKLETNEAGTLR